MKQTLNILMVDDVEFSRELLRSALLACINDKKWDLEPNFYHLANGEKVLETIEVRKINLVYLDIELPEISGLELLKKIKQLFADVTVVMVSGEGSSENVMASIKSGANGFIVKPFNTGRISESLAKFLEQETKS